MKNIKHGIEVANLDLEVSPKEDFYKFACGGWQKANPIPDDYANYGTFDVLRENARNQLRELIDSLGELPDAKVPGTIAQKVNDLFKMGMDAERLNREGAEPLKRQISEFDALWAEKSLEEVLAWFGAGIASPFYSTGVGQDPKDSNRHIMYIMEVGLGLGDRDYYLEENETNAKIMAAYEVYIKKLLELTGYDAEVQERVWKTLIKLETEFAKHKQTREEKRDPIARFNMMTMDEIRSKYSNINWDSYFQTLEINDLTEANITSPKFMEFLNEYLPTLSRQEIYAYCLICLVDSASNVLSEEFEEAGFELYGRVMSGQLEQKERWKRAMAVPNSMFGEAIGELYVEKYFPKENKEYMVALVENLRKALGKHISELEWMSEETKGKALDKLADMTVKIGYPDKWKDYSEIKIDPAKSYMENVCEASKWFTRDNYDKLHKPVDRDEWHMTPQTVNAYYNPTTNEICFPAAILQPPYFDVTADDAQNYGAIGVVIGHEMTHGFDDSGRKFDKDGNLNDWWLPEDAERFNALADKLVAQFDEVVVAPAVNEDGHVSEAVHANGRFTLGENIADQGGLRVALTAWQTSRSESAAPSESPAMSEPSAPSEQQDIIDGYSGLQRFYLAYANVWADNIRAEEILARTKMDPHSLAVNRVNVTLRNLAPFFAAFSIQEGDPMFRPVPDRVIIW